MNLLRQKVLVLNKAWQPIRVITVQKAITLLFSCYKDSTPKAKVIDENFSTLTWQQWLEKSPGTNVIRTVSKIFNVPEVIILTRYSKVPNRQIAFSKANIFRRDNNQCLYCGVCVEQKNRTIDHILPSSRGGADDWLNCVTSCKKCNLFKRNRTPKEAGMSLLKEPYQPTSELYFHDKPLVFWRFFL